MPSKVFELETITVQSKYAPYLARVFSAPVIAEFANQRKSHLMMRILNECGIGDQLDGSMQLKDVFDSVYECISSSYRNEYIYKNALAKKILLENHSLDTAFMLTEFRVGGSKADVVILNGTSHVYEIKTELDTLERLEGQIDSYMSVFDRISIVASEDQLDKIKESVNEDVGLLAFSDENTIREDREALSRKDKVDSAVIFDSLRKSEYMKIIDAHYGWLPDVSNALMYRECKKNFENLPPDVAHDYMVDVLKQRGSCALLKNFIERVPDSLKAVAISNRFTQKQRNNFIDTLGRHLRDCLA